MTNFEKLNEVFKDNGTSVNGVRYVAKYMATNDYCCNINVAINEECENGCVKCWMLHLTDEVK